MLAAKTTNLCNPPQFIRIPKADRNDRGRCGHLYEFSRRPRTPIDPRNDRTGIDGFQRRSFTPLQRVTTLTRYADDIDLPCAFPPEMPKYLG